MARNTLEKLRDCLRDEKPEIEMQPYFAQAEYSLRRSLLE
jgi:quinolinate synthase